MLDKREFGWQRVGLYQAQVGLTPISTIDVGLRVVNGPMFGFTLHELKSLIIEDLNCPMDPNGLALARILGLDLLSKVNIQKSRSNDLHLALLSIP